MNKGLPTKLFPNSRETNASCEQAGGPEDHMDFMTGETGDVEKFAMFMRLLAPPSSVTSYQDVNATSIERGHDAGATARAI